MRTSESGHRRAVPLAGYFAINNLFERTGVNGRKCMSGESILVILLVGLVAGWLAGQIVRGTGYGLVADICIGIIGALIGSWLLPQLGIRIGAGIISSIIVATIGAIILLVILRLVNRGGRW